MAHSAALSFDLKKCISDVLPMLPQGILQQLMDALELCGVTCFDDLKFVREADIGDVLRPVQVRRLLASQMMPPAVQIQPLLLCRFDLLLNY
jgi:hypothetical protein